MHKKTIWILTVVLSVTLIGLIVVQLYWINNAVKIKEEQFSQSVKKGLENIIEEIEKREMVYQVVNEVDPYKGLTSGGKASLNYQYNKLNQSLFSLSTTNHEKEIFVINASDSIKKITQLQQFLGDGILLGNNENLSLSKSNKQKLFKDLNTNPAFAERLKEKTVFVENVVNKLVQIDVELEDRISKEALEEIIRKSFMDIDENLVYEYSVLKNGLEMVYKSDHFDPKTNSKIFTGQLFPKDVFAKDNFIIIYFPEERNYILKSTGFMAFTSVFLTLIIIFGFSFSIHIMFKQKRISQIKNDFVNNMTHELKTPISTISLASQLLKDKGVPMESKNIDYISGIIEDESKRLSYQVEKVLKTALFDQGQIKLKLRELDVHKLIENVVHNFEIQVVNRNGSIEKKLEASRSIAQVDEVHFTNIIFNLLDNAVKYCKDQPEIKIHTRDNKSGIDISVSDNGIGIKKQDQKKIFDQFYRVSTGNLHDVKGFGLGLSYVKKMVEEHGGQITLESELKKGTTFKIFIPTNNIHNGRS